MAKGNSDCNAKVKAIKENQSVHVYWDLGRCSNDDSRQYNHSLGITLIKFLVDTAGGAPVCQLANLYAGETSSLEIAGRSSSRVSFEDLCVHTGI